MLTLYEEQKKKKVNSIVHFILWQKAAGLFFKKVWTDLNATNNYRISIFG